MKRPNLINTTTAKHGYYVRFREERLLSRSAHSIYGSRTQHNTNRH